MAGFSINNTFVFTILSCIVQQLLTKVANSSDLTILILKHLDLRA